MNRYILISLLCLLTCCLTAHAQDPHGRLELAFHKTTSLIFPYAIQSVDRGSGEILAQAPPGVGNVLQVKAARPGFQETNLTVITADGRLYDFSVLYDEHPANTLLRLEAAQATSVLFTGAGLNRKQLEDIAAQLAEDYRFYYGIKDMAGGAKARVEGIYSRGSTLFYRILLTNASPVPYDLDFTRFTLRDRKQAKRTATQEEELLPLYTYGEEDKAVAAGGRKVLVFALEKHNLNHHKELVLHLFEKKGGRHLTLKVRDKDILQACPLLSPDEAGIFTPF
ncbi:conjugative transposon TraN protein [Pontibacter ummariensis]|uniref:Bacteroides conjugative transposon TraN protein n=1 Tax=Pontibacter ummariensis TaxID=1610492 RepID=A0A239LDN6_9BACT|nr:conjugative transposon protein TraN [Pontibacter ummariensis]PRY03678.1 conjugative transposon TraN protein [Pontibacter ummariensis]SNT28028.1 Bacteroides conjugative transposon TraN protein [Pontibacter ummariensis]